MENLNDSLGTPLAHRLAAMARLTDREMDDIIKEAVRNYLDEQEKQCAPGTGFKDILRSWSLEYLDLERVNGRDREDAGFE